MSSKWMDGPGSHEELASEKLRATSSQDKELCQANKPLARENETTVPVILWRLAGLDVVPWPSLI